MGRLRTGRALQRAPRRQPRRDNPAPREPHRGGQRLRMLPRRRGGQSGRRRWHPFNLIVVQYAIPGPLKGATGFMELRLDPSLQGPAHADLRKSSGPFAARLIGNVIFKKMFGPKAQADIERFRDHIEADSRLRQAGEPTAAAGISEDAIHAAALSSLNAGDPVPGEPPHIVDPKPAVTSAPGPQSEVACSVPGDSTTASMSARQELDRRLTAAMGKAQGGDRAPMRSCCANACRSSAASRGTRARPPISSTTWCRTC